MRLYICDAKAACPISALASTVSWDPHALVPDVEVWNLVPETFCMV